MGLRMPTCSCFLGRQIIFLRALETSLHTKQELSKPHDWDVVTVREVKMSHLRMFLFISDSRELEVKVYVLFSPLKLEVTRWMLRLLE